MGLWQKKKGRFGIGLFKGSLLSGIGGFAAARWIRKSRKRWEDAGDDATGAVLEQMTSYELARGAGRLVAGWLRYADAEATLEQQEQRLQALLKQMDPEDNLAEERALSRLLVSKALFSLEGFKLSTCRYEAYQKAAQTELRRNPTWRTISRNALFQASPFEPEQIIGVTHRVLLLLDDGRLAEYLQQALNEAPLRDDGDYMAQLIALTLCDTENDLTQVMNVWFQDYRTFKIHETHRQEAWLNTSMAAVTGELPAMAGMQLLGRLFQRVTNRNASKP